MSNQPKPIGTKPLHYFIAIVCILIGTISVQSCKNSSGDKWDKMKAAFRSGSDSLFADDSSRIRFSNCVVDKFRHKYPNGADDIGQDSANAEGSRFGAACGAELKGKIHFKVTWAGQSALKLKDYLMTTPMVSKLAVGIRSDFCDCFLQKIKERYPDGLREQIPRNVNDSIYAVCFKKLIH
jgi:hypothetical protein